MYIVKQQIFRFNVSMDNIFLMHVDKSKTDLLDEMCNLRLGDSPFAIASHIAIRHTLHD